jgi:hypothetical protein
VSPASATPRPQRRSGKQSWQRMRAGTWAWLDPRRATHSRVQATIWSGSATPRRHSTARATCGACVTRGFFHWGIMAVRPPPCTRPPAHRPSMPAGLHSFRR